jgi:hypothetical protein
LSNFIGGINDVSTVIEVGRWEDLIDGLGCICLIMTCLVRDKLLVGLATHRLIECVHEMFVELLFGLLVKIVITLEQSFLRPEVIFASIASIFLSGSNPPLITDSINWCEGLNLLYYRLARVDLMMG